MSNPGSSRSALPRTTWIGIRKSCRFFLWRNRMCFANPAHLPARRCDEHPGSSRSALPRTTWIGIRKSCRFLFVAVSSFN